jgi:hypothetical protein
LTGSPAPDPEHRPLKPLLDQAPPPEPPDWLDANIRAAAHEAARKAAATRAAGERPAHAGRRRWRWGPLGAVVATAVLGVLIVMNQSRRPDDPTQLAQAPTPSEATATQPASGRSSGAAGAGNGTAASRADAQTDAAKPGPPPAHESKEAVTGALVTAQTERRKADSPAQAKADETLAALPDTARGCVDSVEAMRADQRIDDARRRLRDCRTRYPDYPYPPELLRALPPPETPPTPAPG